MVTLIDFTISNCSTNLGSFPQVTQHKAGLTSCSLDISYIFKYQLPTIKTYVEAFPDPQDQCNLQDLGKMCQSGHFQSDEGLTELFELLEKMVSNCKKFNHQNSEFQIWRLADMMEMEIYDLRRTLAENHHLPVLFAAALRRENFKKTGEERQIVEL